MSVGCRMPDVGSGTRARRAERRARRGFTIIEVIVIVVILGVLAAVIAPRLIQRIGQSKQSVAAANASSLASTVQGMMTEYKLEPGMSINILMEGPVDAGWKGPYLQNADQLNDPWGRPFVLVVPGSKNIDFDIVTYGADGQPGGEGEDADIVKP
jgi:general secretion pathway protein G